MLKFVFIMLVLASAAQGVVWNEGISGELHWKETLSLENYTLKLIDFSSEESTASMALVELQADNLTIASRALQAGEWFSLNDSIRITAEQIVKGDIQDDPFARIRMQLAAAADISLLLTGNREIYQGGDEMGIKLQITNRGIVDAENLRITLDSMPSFVNRIYNISIVEAGRVWDKKEDTREIDSIKINMRTPYFSEPTDLELRAHAQYSDPQGTAYESWGGTTFRISGPIQLHKRVEETQQFQERYHVINSLRNSGNRTLTLDLSDSTGSGFQADSSLRWRINLSPGETRTASYLIEAKQPGLGQILPNSVVSYVWDEKSFTVRSEKPVVDVFGPLIEAERSIRPTNLQPGEVATVSIQLTNTGNKDAVISVGQFVPGGTELISGRLNESIMLAPNETHSEEYQLRCIEQGIVRLPSNEIIYRDVRGNEHRAIMQELEIDVQEEKEEIVEVISDMEITDAQTETVKADKDIGRPDAKTDGKDDRYDEKEEKSERLSALLILIVLLLSAAFSRYP